MSKSNIHTHDLSSLTENRGGREEEEEDEKKYLYNQLYSHPLLE